jgi:hypothetical protein
MPIGAHPIGVVKHPYITKKGISSFFIVEGMPTHNKGIQKNLPKYIWEATPIGSSQQGFEPSHDPPLLQGTRAYCMANRCHPRHVGLWFYLVS